MIHNNLAAKSASLHRDDKPLKYDTPMPIFETVDEARQSLILERGNHEYYIKESPVIVDLFDVCWVADNKLYSYQYKKKVTGYRK